MNNFDDDCFGTIYESQYLQGYDQNLSKSAYILVYDKVKKSKLKLKFDSEHI